MATNPRRQQYYLRSIPVRKEILDPDARLLPDLSAQAEVLVEREENVLIAPSEAVKEENGQSYVYVQKGDNVERRSVSIGRMHGPEAVVLEGVNEGEREVIE